jgi:hypothetical protein
MNGLVSSPRPSLPLTQVWAQLGADHQRGAIRVLAEITAHFALAHPMPMEVPHVDSVPRSAAS